MFVYRRPLSKIRRVYEWGADLDTADTEFDKGAKHLPARNLICGPADADFNQKTVVVRGDLSTCETGTGIESDTIATSTAIDLDLSCVRLEVCRCIFRSNATLNCEAALSDRVLRQTELGKSRTSGYLNLGRNNVESGNLLCYRIGKCIQSIYGKVLSCDGMLDLDARINFDKVVSSLLID